ncbi:MAG: nucleoside triphosphate pyrophosphohydrolase [Hyphomicrobiales bacterium]|nr:nucleoside triphosphate pyrophosphohydrolase [Hyphomicrobiales bacterium]
MKPARDLARLIEIMAALRTPGSGCPWDLEQTFATIAPYTIEEAYEVADAIERADWSDLTDELGDLLLQVVFHARIAEEAGLFAFPDVVEAITTKLVRRHPHVFGDGNALSPEEVKASWGRIKAEEKRLRAARRGGVEVAKGLLADVPAALPGLTRAVKLQAKASTVGFDWNDARLVLAKIKEEIAEFEEAADLKDPDAMRGEIGDLLFAVANLARHVDVDPEDAVRATNAKFERRFAHIEQALVTQGRSLDDATLSEMDALWDEAKRLERS